MPKKLLDLRNKKIFFWCCKPLGLYGLRQLVHLKKSRFPQLNLVGIGVSSSDIYRQKIIRLAKTYWPACVVFVDRFEVTTACDLGLCVGFPFKISSTSIDCFKNGVVNLHFALLPQYRGSGTLERALLDDAKEYGLTLHYIDSNLDTGDVVARRKIPISKEDTLLTLLPKLELLGREMLDEWIPRLLTKKVTAIPQNKFIETEHVTPIFCTRKKTASYYQISKTDSFEHIYRKVRALDKGSNKRPYFEHAGKRIYLTLEQ